jgi:hypothetical protein
MAMKRTWWLAPLVLGVAMAAPAGALAAGGPVPPVQSSYIGLPGSPYRYGAFGAHGNTVVREQEAGAGAAVPGLRIRGRYGIPGVDYSGSMTGLSADGRTLILAQIPAGTPHTTRLLVLETPQLTVRARLALPGWSTVDAISPDGRWLYLIHYPSSDPTKYEVLGYDLPAHRFLPHPVVDPREPDEAMTGIAVNRVMSAGGRWAYTLYMRPSGVPFIHALDTTHHTAVCIDLRPLANSDISNGHLILVPGGRTLRVENDGASPVSIDTRTFRVSAGGGHAAATPLRPTARVHRAATSPSDVPWELIVVAIAALGVVAASGARAAKRRRHRDFPRGPDGAAIIHVDARATDRATSDDELPVA